MQFSPNREIQFGLSSIFVLTALVAVLAALPAVAAFLALLIVGYLICASGWIVDIVINIKRTLLNTVEPKLAELDSEPNGEQAQVKGVPSKG